LEAAISHWKKLKKKLKKERRFDSWTVSLIFQTIGIPEVNWPEFIEERDTPEARPDERICNLPLRSIGLRFKGRKAFLDDLRDSLGILGDRATTSASPAAVVVHGHWGVGKTQTAIEHAWRHANQYTALLFVSAPSPAELRSNLANLVDALGMRTEATRDELRLSEVLHWLDAHPGWLLIIDNVDTENAAQEVERLLARLRAGHVLITSRITNWSTVIERRRLDVLPAVDAVEFLLERTPERQTSADDESRAREIVRELGRPRREGCLAVLLEQAGAYIDKLRLSFAQYLQRWKSQRLEVLRWHHPRLCPVEVAVTFVTTFAQLTEPAKRLLEVLACLAPRPIPKYLLDAPSLKVAIPDAPQACSDLEAYSLAQRDDSADAILVYRLDQQITQDRMAKVHRAATQQIVLDVVKDILKQIMRDPDGFPIQPFNAAMTQTLMLLPWFFESMPGQEPDWGTLADGLSEEEQFTALSHAGSLLIALKGWADKAVGQVYRTASSIAQKEVASGAAHASSRQTKATMALMGLWSHHLTRGDLKAATTIAQKMLKLARWQHDMTIVALRHFGTNALWLGQFEKAEQHLRPFVEKPEQYLHPFEELSQHPDPSDLTSIAWWHYLSRQLSIAGSDLADALWVLGRYSESLRMAQLAYDYARTKDQRLPHCYSLAFSGWIHFKLQRFDLASKHAEDLLELSLDSGFTDFRAFGKMLKGIVRAFREANPTDAIKEVSEGFHERRAGGSKLPASPFLVHIAEAWLRVRQIRKAQEVLNEALTLCTETGERYAWADVRRFQGEINRLRKDFVNAAIDLHEALKIARRQRALTFQLRAAMSLLRLARERTDLNMDQKRKQIVDHEKRLKSIYDSFPEADKGGDFAELKSAFSMLNNTGPPQI